MKIVIPMAGTGNRFLQAGYVTPKPLIDVNGKRIIEYILDLFTDEDEIIFICNGQHMDCLITRMQDTLLELQPDARILTMPNHKKGPVYTVQQAYDYIKDDEEVIICYCDNPYIWNRDDFIQHVTNNNLDGCVLSHTGMHPHTLNSTKMAFMKTENELMLEIKEKECYTDNPMQEHASTGTYYFRRGDQLKKYCDLAIEQDLSYNGEYYVTLVYNLLVQDGLRVGYFDTEFVTVFGTPEEVQNFESWARILRGGQVQSEEDLIQCYRYWKKYHGINIT